MKKLLITSLILLNAHALDYTEAEKILSGIKDPVLKKAMAEKMASELISNEVQKQEVSQEDSSEDARDIGPKDIMVQADSVESSEDQEFRDVANVQTSIQKSDLGEKDTKSETEIVITKDNNKKNEAGGYIGLSGYGASLDVNGVRTDLSGTSIGFGAVKRSGASVYRLGLQILNTELDSMTNDGIEVDLRDYGVDVSYAGAGLSGSFTYFTSDTFGVGAYANFVTGDLEACGSNAVCYEAEADIFEFGLRMDLLVGNWNPYVGLGISQFREAGESPYSGVSAYFGLLNFEF